MTRPRCTVVVPAHDRPRALARCLEALARLDYPADRFGVVVVDDGSPEPLRPVAERAREGGLDVACVRQENAGPAAARNRGAAASDASILAFTDDDCRPEPGWLDRLALTVEAEPSALVGGRTVNALPDNPWSEASQQLVAYLYEYYLPPSGPRPRAFLTSNNMAVAREPFVAAGGFSELFPDAAAEDREFCERWMAAGRDLRRVPEAVVRHHHPLDAISFLEQHFRYGRGARRFREAVEVEATRGLEPPAFYLDLLRWPFRHGDLPRASSVAARFCLSQVANALGYFRESAARMIEPG